MSKSLFFWQEKRTKTRRLVFAYKFYVLYFSLLQQETHQDYLLE